MSKPLEKLDLGEHNIKINKHSIKAKVTAKVHHDDDNTVEDMIDDAKIREQLNADIASGRLTSVYIVVTASVLNCEGEDSLSGTVIRSAAEILPTISDHGMIENALADLKLKIKEQIKLFKPYM